MVSDRDLRVVVIGGGAAGFFGAITCAETYPRSHVILLEASPQVLTKVRISGGGRCNVTHACFDPAALIQNYPRGHKALRGSFSRFQPRHTVAWFEDRGVQLKTESDGRMFPITDSSETIADCLIQSAQTAGVQIRTRSPVIGLSVSSLELGSQFQIQFKQGEILTADRILLATGSSSLGYRLARSLGHTIVDPVPSLFTFNVTDPRLQDLMGISVQSVGLKLQINENTKHPTKRSGSSRSQGLQQTGPLLITHWGLSGPAVLKLSAWGARILQSLRYQAPLQVNWIPAHNPDSLRQLFQSIRTTSPQKSVIAHSPVDLPTRLWRSLLNYVQISDQTRWAEVSNKALHALIQELTQGIYHIRGKGIFKEEFVTCGGVDLKEVEFKTMQSRCCPGLFLAGEILDIDGVTGGFNFQSAWTTGWLAGHAIGAPTLTRSTD